ncbi:TetR/AcrR family transcriptional regulator [Streptomyces malaysiensis]|uniref:TetR/AcrR family transcriptional regulator n=1 Tax=Streptomyces malaysiensis TaxID=92644 RepID=UPI0036898CE5
MTEAEAIPQPRERILQAAADLLTQRGREAVSTRAVSAAAGVQAQTIYRHFGDMRGLLDAVARRGYADYLAAKQAHIGAGDPVEQVRDGWDLHIAFALANPAVYRLLYADPRPDAESPLTGEAHKVLLGLVEGIAKVGRLRTSVESAAAMVHSSGVGVALTLIAAQAGGNCPSTRAWPTASVMPCSAPSWCNRRGAELATWQARRLSTPSRSKPCSATACGTSPPVNAFCWANGWTGSPTMAPQLRRRTEHIPIAGGRPQPPSEVLAKSWARP